MNWISLALRNLLRNRRRSITTIAAVALGYAATNVFAGFAGYMFKSIEEAHIYEELNGHIQIWRSGARQYAGGDPAAYLIEEEQFAEIKAIAAADPRIDLAAGAIEMQGNLDYDGLVAHFFGRAMMPSEKAEIQSRATALRSPGETVTLGEEITDETLYAIGVAPGLAENFNLEPGSEVILMSPTVHGQMNAVDAGVRQIIEVNAEILNNRFVFLPLPLAQELYGTGGVDRVHLLLRDGDEIEEVAADLRRQLPAAEWDVIPWQEGSVLYGRTKRMFDIIFGLVFAIIAVIVVMSVLNTIGMAVIERTREIGTLRAIGLKRPGVVRLFGIESAMLGTIGAGAGLVATLLFSLAVSWIEPVWEPPVTARAVVWEILVQPPTLAFTFVLLVLFTSVAAIAPARRAAAQSIVNSLGHV